KAAHLYDRAAEHLADPHHAIFNRAVALYEQDRLETAKTDFDSTRVSEDQLRQGRASYDAGNCALKMACTEANTPTNTLQDAIEHYQACIDMENALPANLVADARTNQELARQLLQSKPDQKNSGASVASSGDPSSDGKENSQS